MMPSRFSDLFLILVGALGMAGCASRDAASVRVVDLLRELERAEMRPAPAAFEAIDFEASGVSHASIVTTAPSRLIFTMPFPRRATFRCTVTIASTTSDPSDIRFRVGISDDRIYERLAEAVVSSRGGGWTEMRADLSAYAGWKWSLFYRPDRIAWRLVLSTDVVGGAPAHAAWGLPAVYAGVDDARSYAKRPDVRLRTH